MDIPKKKIVIKVKPHTISVGAKKPSNGGKGIETPIESVNLRKSLFRRCLDVVAEDLHLRKVESRAIMKDPDKEWEEYIKFLKMAEGDRKE